MIHHRYSVRALGLFFYISMLHNKVGGMLSIRSQVLKGILEGCILAVIERETVYGYELAMKLQKEGLTVKEGSIYPLLLRLQKENLIYGKMQKSPSGPNRKYYYLSEDGKIALDMFRNHWEEIKTPIDQLLEKGNEDECR